MVRTQKVDLDNNYNFKKLLRQAIDQNCCEVMYEGTEVDKEGIIRDIIEALKKEHYSMLHHIKI